MKLHAVIISLMCICIASTVDAQSFPTQTMQWRVTRTLPHSVDHFTQGLELHDGTLLESTGLYGRSAVFEKSLETGDVREFAQLPRNWFGEGLTVWHGRVIVLTWMQHIAQLFDLELQDVGRLHYKGEGWGLTHDDAHLIMSDGSATIRFRKPDDFSVAREIEVTDRGSRVFRLNELEFARGRIFANVWQSDRIAVIDPDSGVVDAWLDMSALHTRLSRSANWNPAEHVLNGIAYDPASDLFYVTGKCWPALFEIEVSPMPLGNARPGHRYPLFPDGRAKER